MKQHRYPGAQPFTTAQQALFFGRDDDTVRLHRLIKTEPLVVLHAKSGMGKSSLLNAGIIPAVLHDAVYTPLQIRFNAWTEGKTELPADIARRAISPEGSKRTFLDSLIENESSLWHELKETQLLSEGRRKYLLLFDQFEELFTYPPEAIDAFREQLAEALYTKIPHRYRRVLEEQIEQGTCQLRDDEFDRLQEPIPIRIVLSIRSDRLHLMDRLSDSLPDILAHCYELGALGPGQAAAAVVEPARRTGNFYAPPFTYSGAAVERILDFLKYKKQPIEAIQLQILCRAFEERAEREGLTHFEKETLGDLDGIISGFYHRQLAALGSAADQRRACLLIEEGLIVPEDRQRLTLHEAQITKLFEVTREQLAQLVDGGLLRAEPALRGGYAYELSHDTLVGPALEARIKRRDKEAAEARAQQERETAVALAAERRKRRRTRNLALVFALLALFSFLAAGWALRQTQKARAAESEALRQKEEALAQKKRADENFQIAELNEKTARTEKENAELQRLLAQNAERAARQLAAKGSRLQSAITSADTYKFLMREGRNSMRDGNYRHALTNFATARFIQETSESNAAITAAKTGLEADKRFFYGELAEARTAYQQVWNTYPDSNAYTWQRLNDIQNTVAVFTGKLGGQDPSTVKALVLEFQSLRTLPASIGELSQLETLDLSHNSELSRLPPAIGRLKNLRVLTITDGGLTELPAAIGQLSALEKLTLLNNPQLTALPPETGRLQRLKDLNVEECGLTALPAAIGQLIDLERLNLSKTPLQKLPPETGRLKHLKELSMSNMLPGDEFDWGRALSLIAPLTALQTLDLSRNALHRSGPDFWENLTQLRQVVELNLQFNGLKTLPPEIAGLQNLKTLDLRNNSFDESAKNQIRNWLPNCQVKF